MVDLIPPGNCSLCNTDISWVQDYIFKISIGAQTVKRRHKMDEYPITHQSLVYPWHCDHMGHMNVMWYVSKFDEATWALFATIGITAEYLRNNALGMAAVDQHIKYKAELLAGDLVVVGSHWLEVKEKSLRFCHHMYNSQTGKLAATCELVAVQTHTKNRKSHAFDTKIIANVKAALGGQ